MTDTARQVTGRPENGPQRWAFALFVAFGAAQLIAGAVFFFAYNWRDLSDPVKVALPQAALVLGFLVWAVLPRASRLGAVAGLLATVMIGVSMGVVGQVYQLGADPGRLFAVWAALALYGVQIAIGALNILSGFAELVLVAHLAVGSAIWALLVLIIVVGRFELEIDRTAYSADTLRSPAADPGA